MTILPPITLRESRSIDGEDCLRCSKCKDWKPKTQFTPNRHRRSGYHSRCKPCKSQENLKTQAKFRARAAAKRTEMAQEELLKAKTGKVLSKLGTPSQKPRKRIPAMSEQKRKWTDLYREKCEADPEIVTGYDLKWDDHGEPVIVPVMAHKLSFDRHHTGRRHRWLILWYAYVSPVLHEWIEANSAKARELGLLFSVESGHLRNPSEHDPLQCLEEFYRLQDRYIFTTVLR
jgi:hypothetical protein